MTMTMHRFGFVLAAGATMIFGVAGCATKKYVHNQTAPLVTHAGELDQKTAENERDIHDVDQRAQAGISHAQQSADSANQNAQQAGQSAEQADSAANNVAHRADSLDEVVKNLDNYKHVSDVTVTFGFNKAILTADDKQQLDSFGAQLNSAKSFILEVTGGTDTTGSAQYNYELSQRRADAVVQYLASKYNVPARRFYLIGVGKDVQVAPDNTAAGRKQNRRVQVQLLSNQSSQNGPQNSAAAGQPNGQ